MSGGYRRQPTNYLLKFEDYPGLEVFTKGVNVEEYLQVVQLNDAMTSMPSEAQVRDLFDWFASRLVSWNLQDEAGDAVPATLAGLLGEELEFALKIVMAWVQRVAGVAPPLKKPSAGGPPAEELEIPMTPVPASPGS